MAARTCAFCVTYLFEILVSEGYRYDNNLKERCVIISALGDDMCSSKVFTYTAVFNC